MDIAKLAVYGSFLATEDKDAANKVAMKAYGERLEASVNE